MATGTPYDFNLSRNEIIEQAPWWVTVKARLTDKRRTT
jgi:hypothetical protein